MQYFFLCPLEVEDWEPDLLHWFLIILFIIFTIHEAWDFFWVYLTFEGLCHLSNLVQGLALDVCDFLIFCLNGGGVPGPCGCVCRISKCNF